MEKSWNTSRFSKRKRDFMERDPRYREAMNHNDVARAQELVCWFCCGGEKEFLNALNERIDYDLLKLLSA
jgi:hypothetical protein